MNASVIPSAPRQKGRTLILAALLFGSAAQAHARCGVERWNVKTGKDSDALSIDLSSPTPTTIHFLTDLTRFPAPAHWPPPGRIAPEEMTVWTLDATLDSFKFENDPQSGDSDYHLIIKDDLGNTMVAEIPFPGCVQGSAWESQITTGRATFDSTFTATSSFTSAHNTPVRITGVAIFDKLAHGSGHSANGMEIHPVLSIVFNPGPEPSPVAPGPTSVPTVAATATPTTTLPPTGANLIQNGDFENGDLGWQVAPDVITNQTQAKSGFWCAWLGGLGRTHTDTLSQSVSLPSGGSSATLSFWLHIETDEIKPSPFDTLKIQIADEAGNVLKTLHMFSNVDATPHYERVHFDVSAFLGKTVQVRFVASEDGQKLTSFFVDLVQLVTSP